MFGRGARLSVVGISVVVLAGVGIGVGPVHADDAPNTATLGSPDARRGPAGPSGTKAPKAPRKPSQVVEPKGKLHPSRGIKVSNVVASRGARVVSADVRWDAVTAGMRAERQLYVVRMVGLPDNPTKKAPVVVTRAVAGLNGATALRLNRKQAQLMRQTKDALFTISQRFDAPDDGDALFEDFHTSVTHLRQRGGVLRQVGPAKAFSQAGGSVKRPRRMDLSGADLSETKPIGHFGGSPRTSGAGTNPTGPMDHCACHNMNYNKVDFTGATMAGGDFTGSLFSQANLNGQQLAPNPNQPDTANGIAMNQTYLGPATVGGVNYGPASLQNANFNTAQLASADLTNVDISSTGLSNANLSGATLAGVNLMGQNLAGAKFQGTNLTVIANSPMVSAPSVAGASFNGANLQGANLTGVYAASSFVIDAGLPTGWMCQPAADFTNADLRNANLTDLVVLGNLTCDNSGAVSVGMPWHGVDLRGATVSAVLFWLGDFSPSSSRPTNLSGLSISAGNDPDFSGLCPGGTGQLCRTNFTNAIMHNVNLSGQGVSAAVWTGADLDSATLSGIQTLSGNFLGTRFTNIVFPSGMNFSSAWLAKAVFDGSTMPAVVFGNAVLTGASLRNTNMAGAKMVGVGLFGADLTGSTLTTADLTGANLLGADLSYVKMQGVNLAQARLIGATLNFAVISGANLTGTFLSRISAISMDASPNAGTPTNFQEIVTGAGDGLDGANLAGANLTGAILTGIDFTNIANKSSGMVQTNLTNAILTNANLSGVSLSASIMTNAELGSANLTGGVATGLSNQANCAVTVWYDGTVKNGACTP